MRVILQKALTEATAGLGAGSTKGVEDDSNRTAARVKSIFSSVSGHLRSVVSGFNQAVASGTRLTLLATAAGVGLAAISSLVTGVVGLVGVLGQAAGVVGLLPAAFLAVKAATATVKIGLENVGDAFTALASGDAAAFSESLKKLAPEARAFVTEVAKVKPVFDQMKLGVQNQLFAGLSQSVASLAGRYLPLAKDLFGGIAREMNLAAKEAINFANNGEVAGQVGLLFRDLKGTIAQLRPALVPVISAFLDISQVGASFLPGLAAGFAGVAQRFGDFIRQSAASGQLAAFFRNAIDTVIQLGQILGQIGGIFAGVFRAAQTAGGGFLNSLLSITTAFHQFVDSAQGQGALVSFFSSMREIIAAVIPVVLTVVQVLATTLVPIFADIAKTILPVLNSVIQQFGAALQAARPGIMALVQGLATLLEVFGPTITFAVQLAGILGGVLGKVLQVLAPVLARVANAILNGLMAVMPKLEPVIIQVTEAIVQLLDALIPIIPLFFEILAAVLPILPPFIQLVAAILPPLISLIQSLLPIIQAFAQILIALIPPITSVVTTILGVLIPPIQLIAAVVSQVAQLVASVFTGMSAAVTTILNLLGSIITGIWGTIVGVFTGAVNTIGNLVRGGFDAIKNVISNILGGIKNVVSDGINGVVGFFRELPGKVLGFLSGLAGDAVEAGANIIRGIIRGLGNLAGAIVDKIKSIVSNAWSAVTDFFAIFSPSHRARDDFEQVGRGAILGLERIGPQVKAAAAAMAADAMAAINDPLASGITIGVPSVAAGTATGAGAGGITLNQVNVMQPGADVMQFASEVSRAGAAKLSSGANSLPVSRGPAQAGMASPDSVFGVTGVGA
jgi:phage-related protein